MRTIEEPFNRVLVNSDFLTVFLFVQVIEENQHSRDVFLESRYYRQILRTKHSKLYLRLLLLNLLTKQPLKRINQRIEILLRLLSLRHRPIHHKYKLIKPRQYLHNPHPQLILKRNREYILGLGKQPLHLEFTRIGLPHKALDFLDVLFEVGHVFDLLGEREDVFRDLVVEEVDLVVLDELLEEGDEVPEDVEGLDVDFVLAEVLGAFEVVVEEFEVAWGEELFGLDVVLGLALALWRLEVVLVLVFRALWAEVHVLVVEELEVVVFLGAGLVAGCFTGAGAGFVEGFCGGAS
jgi:hypothetical protein